MGLGVTSSVFCQHRGVSGGLTHQYNKNHFFRFFDHFTYFSSISLFLETTKWALHLRNDTHLDFNINSLREYYRVTKKCFQQKF